MADSTAQLYLNLLGEDEKAKLALLACSVALRLDDDLAREAIELVAQSNGSTNNLMRRVKKLGCVRKQWDNSWYIAEDVRPYLVEQLYNCASETAQSQLRERMTRLRERLAQYAAVRAQNLPSNGQITAYKSFQADFEAAYHQMFIPERLQSGAAKLADLWVKHYPGSAAQATAQSAEYLAQTELRLNFEQTPVEILFLRGMAARSQRNKEAQKEYFGAVWKLGREQERRGYIFAIAAHLFGLLYRDRKTAEQALRDSLRWYDANQHQCQVLHSLGNLLSRGRRNRWSEAEEVYRQSIELDDKPHSQAITWHSLGRLLAKQHRWSEAEEAYKEGIVLDQNLISQAQTWHSLGNLLSNHELKDRWEDAEAAYWKSLDLRVDREDKAQVYHSLGLLLSKKDNRARWPEAEEYYWKSINWRDNAVDKGKVYHSLGNLLSQYENRWEEAEKAFKRSYELLFDPEDKAQVLASWASNLLLKSRSSEDYKRVEELVLESLMLGQEDIETRAKCQRVLADLQKARESS